MASSYDNFEMQMIRNQNKMIEEITIMSRRIESLENQIETIVSGQHSIIGAINRTIRSKGHSRSKRQETKLIKHKKKLLSPSDVSKLVHLPEALQRNISKFTQNILFTSSNIHDDLVTMQCLSEDECTDITSKTNPKDQVRLLIRKIKSRGPDSINSFLKAVEKDRPELITEVYKTLDEIVNEYKDKPVCAICVMKNTVNLKDIVDSLWAEKIISDDIFQDIIDSNSLHQSRPLIWSSIMVALNDLADQGKAKEILINALKPKYEHIVGYINQNPERPSLNCWCCTKCRRIRHRPLVSEFGSQTDVSLPSSRLPKVIDDDNVSVDDLPSSQSLPSNELSFNNPEYFDNIQIPVIDSTVSSSSFEPRTGTVNNQVHFIQEANTDDDFVKSTEGQPQEKQELKHSISTISNSTICAEITSSAPNTAGIESINNFQNMFQSELKKDEIKSNQVNLSLSRNYSTIDDQGIDDGLKKQTLVKEDLNSNDDVMKEKLYSYDEDMVDDESRDIVENNDQGMDDGAAGEAVDNKDQDTVDGAAGDIADNKDQGMAEFETNEISGSISGKAAKAISNHTDNDNGYSKGRKITNNSRDTYDDAHVVIDGNKPQDTDNEETREISDDKHQSMEDDKTQEIFDINFQGNDDGVATEMSELKNKSMGRTFAGECIDNTDEWKGEGEKRKIDEIRNTADKKDESINIGVKEDITENEHHIIIDGEGIDIAEKTETTDNGIDNYNDGNIDQSNENGAEKYTDVRRKGNTLFSLIPQIELKGSEKLENIETENYPQEHTSCTTSQEDTPQHACSGGYTPSTEQVRKDKHKTKRQRKQEKRKERKKQLQKSDQ